MFFSPIVTQIPGSGIGDILAERTVHEDAKILLVDDETVFANNMSKLLTRRGYQVTAVNSGDAALQALMNNSFDLMVLESEDAWHGRNRHDA